MATAEANTVRRLCTFWTHSELSPSLSYPTEATIAINKKTADYKTLTWRYAVLSTDFFFLVNLPLPSFRALPCFASRDKRRNKTSARLSTLPNSHTHVSTKQVRWSPCLRACSRCTWLPLGQHPPWLSCCDSGASIACQPCPLLWANRIRVTSFRVKKREGGEQHNTRWLAVLWLLMTDTQLTREAGGWLAVSELDGCSVTVSGVLERKMLVNRRVSTNPIHLCFSYSFDSPPSSPFGFGIDGWRCYVHKT